MATLSSLRAPYPPECVASIFNPACANVMAQQCESGSQNDNSPVLTSDLMNPQSNCFTWRIEMEAAYAINPSSVPYIASTLDRAKSAWCTGAGQNSPECKCLIFPIQQSNQCALQDKIGGVNACPTKPANECWGRYFVRGNNGCQSCQTPTGTPTPCTNNTIQITLGNCVPYYCWVEECLNPTQQLITSAIQSAIPIECKTQVCLSVNGTDNIDINHQPLMPLNGNSSNFTPGYNLMPSCGSPQFPPPPPSMLPTIYTFPIDQINGLPVVISNSGNANIRLDLASAATSQGWATLPSAIYVPSKGIVTVNLQVNYNTLYQQWSVAYQNGRNPSVVTSAVSVPAAGQIPAPSWTYTYTPAGSQLQQFVISFANKPFTLVLEQPATNASKTVVVQPTAPRYIIWATIIVAIVFLFILLKTNADDVMILRSIQENT